jgi:hypothetical protein
LFTFRAEAPFDGLENCGKTDGPSGLVLPWGKKEMDVFGHDDGGMEMEFAIVAFQAALKNGITSFGREWS